MDKNKQLEYLRGLEKLKASGIKSPDYTSPLDKDVMKVTNLGSEVSEPVTKLKNMTQKIDTKNIAPVISGEDFASKIKALRAAKGAGKKVLGALPFLGAGVAALQGDPAMAAEELASDVTGPVGEALRSESVGESPEEESQMLSEINARKAYQASPAAKDKLQKLRSLMGKK